MNGTLPPDPKGRRSISTIERVIVVLILLFFTGCLVFCVWVIFSFTNSTVLRPDILFHVPLNNP